MPVAIYIYIYISQRVLCTDIVECRVSILGSTNTMTYIGKLLVSLAQRTLWDIYIYIRDLPIELDSTRN